MTSTATTTRPRTRSTSLSEPPPFYLDGGKDEEEKPHKSKKKKRQQDGDGEEVEDTNGQAKNHAKKRSRGEGKHDDNDTTSHKRTKKLEQPPPDDDDMEKEQEEEQEQPAPKESRTKQHKDKPDDHNTDNNKRSKPTPASPSPSPPTTIATKSIHDFNLSPGIIAALSKRNITSLFEIQYLTLSHVLEGKDVVGRARTGTGKTLAFSIPIIELLLKHDNKSRGRTPAALIMAPTRELALQVATEFQSTGPHLKVCTVYGGQSYDVQLRALSDGVDVVVGTPGRLIDLLERKSLKLSSLRFLVLDEADQMLDMGFEEEMSKVFDAVKGLNIQTLLFSATMPPWVKSVTAKRMRAPIVTIDLVGDSNVKASTDVDHMCMMASPSTEQRAQVINDLLQVYGQLAGDGRAIVFCSTKKVCDEFATSAALRVEIKPLHGDIQQAARERTLAAFRRGQIKVLVATDVAARGLDIKGVDLVINNGPPAGNLSRKADSETYVHRSGRTGRAGRKGSCITLYGPYEQHMIDELEKATGNTLRRIAAPQPRDMVGAAAKAATEACEQVPEEVAKLFETEAQALIDVLGAERAVQSCLARITGFDDASSVKARSLLQSAEGWITVKFEPGSGKAMFGKALALGAIRSMFSAQACDGARGMCLTLDNKAAYFDLDVRFEKELRSKISKGQASEFSIPTELPLLQTGDLGGSGGNRNGGRNFGGGSRGGRGGFGASSRGFQGSRFRGGGFRGRGR